MPYSAKSIANFFLELAGRAERSVDPLKMQKLVYYAHGWYAGFTGEPLINESIEAWPYGPVIPSLYREFRRYGNGSIKQPASEVSGFLKYISVPVPEDDSLRAFLCDIWDKYAGYTAWRLSEMTHAPDGPWDVTRRNNPGIRGVDIQFEVIRDHFEKAVANTSVEIGD